MSQLAIVIPYFKIRFFRETLSSLASQTNLSFNVYIGNDCSSENPESLIAEFKKELSISYKAFPKNLGSTDLVSQWSRCIAMTRSEKYIMILGDDDLLGPNCVEQFYQRISLIEEKEIKVFRFATQIIDASGQQIGEAHKGHEYENALDFFMRKLQGEARSSLSEYIFLAKDISDSLVNLPLAWYADDLLYLNISNLGMTYTTNEAKVAIRASAYNISGNQTVKREKNRASNLFFHYLLINFKNRFTKEVSNVFIAKLEKSVINDKTNISLFLNLLEVYFKFGKLNRLPFFLSNAYKSIRF
ncbi:MULTISPECIES: glycosyltransferase [unclassified Leeuwenhoekiella]|uniref:glycosyltransferase n=1 Tax=unclassified Leeuwenhoekiella TaxID=2615029 RepID=UPI000C35E195|nr:MULTISPECIES: glycosyltransferase [unclassified Leeuwenhoekiella]MAW96663.1 glycosyl transferase [Leeuwenhoekiella sp.]MBA81552.1 glycosyl transferase [Leeuwenhoekiella sp.]|tara:strand:+ start:1285 stop:2187 length:903 start_codon:yes stop_codon:yes gene_type:complete